MNQRRAVDRVLAIIARIVMAAGNIHLSFIHERVALRALVRERRSGLHWIVRILLQGIVGYRVPGKRESGLRQRNTRRRGVASVVDKTRKRQRVVRAATL